MSDRRDNRGGTRAEYLVELARVVSVRDLLNGNSALGDFHSPLFAKLQRGLARDTRENRACKQRSYDLAVDNEEDVHRTDFLNIFLLHAVQPENLLVILIMSLVLTLKGDSVVSGGLGKSRTASYGADVLFLYIDLNGVKTGRVVRSRR